MLPTTIHTNQAPAAIGPYSQARSNGQLVFTSGQIALTADGQDKCQESVEIQTQIAMQNVSEILKQAGTSLDKALKITIYLIDMNDFHRVNHIYGSFFTGDPPARATIAVAALPKNAKVQIDCIAML